MVKMLPDRTFYPSAALAAESPAEGLAYVALLALRVPHRLHVFGDAASGYIVTPVTAEIAARVAVDGLDQARIGSLAAP